MILSHLRDFGLLASAVGFLGTLLTAGWVAPARVSANLPGPSWVAAASPDTVIGFADDILPIFQQRCAKCHGGEDEDGQVITEAYLNLLSYEGVTAGSEYGTVIEPGDPDASTLVDMITSGEMPEEGDPVPPEEIELIRAWIEAGALDN